MHDRIVALIDMDCFYVQCHLEKEPEYRGVPSVVAQYHKSRDALYEGQFDDKMKNLQRGGEGIIAVSYEARAKGIKRGETRYLRDAKKICPEIHAFVVEEKYGKACLNLYRDASRRVINIMKRFCPTMERSSIDECYLDLTEISRRYKNATDKSQLPNCWLSGCETIEESVEAIIDSDDDFNRATRIVADIRKAIYDELGFTCSAGISVNKMAAKFIAGLKKPNAQSVLLPEQVLEYFETVPIQKLRGLGGKLGHELCVNFGISKCGELNNVSDQQLKSVFDDSTSKWIRDMCRGHDEEPIKIRYIADSCGSGRNFLGVDSIVKVVQVHTWVKAHMNDLFDRLEEFKNDYNKVPKKMIIHISWHEDEMGNALDGKKVKKTRFEERKFYTAQKSSTLDFIYNYDMMVNRCSKHILTFNKAKDKENVEPAIRYLMFNAQQFENMEGNKLTDFFKPAAKPKMTSETSSDASKASLDTPSTGVNFKKRKSSDFLENTPKKKVTTSPVKGGIAAFLTKSSPTKSPFSKVPESEATKKTPLPKKGIASFFTKNQKKSSVKSSYSSSSSSSLKTKEDEDLERALKLSLAEVTKLPSNSSDLNIIDQSPGPSNRTNTTPGVKYSDIPKTDTSWVGEFDLSLLDEIPKHRRKKAFQSLRTIPCNLCFQPVSLSDFKQHVKQHLIENHIL